VSVHPYTEDQLVEQPAIGLFAELGWDIAVANPHPGPLPCSAPSPQPLPVGEGVIEGEGDGGGAGVWVDESGLFGRETKGEVVLVSRLRAAFERLNPALPPEAITAAVDELTRDRSAMSLPAANREIYTLIKEGIPVSVAQPEDSPSPVPSPRGRGKKIEVSKDYSESTPLPPPRPLGEAGVRMHGMGEGKRGESSRQGGGQRIERVRVVDWDSPGANEFLLVSQFSVTGALYTCRPDLVGFVNGLPLVVIELKKPGVAARAGFDDNLTHYKDQIPALFWYNAVMIASNGTDSRVGSLTADWERFFEWKRIEREDEPRRVSLETMIRGRATRTACSTCWRISRCFPNTKRDWQRSLGKTTSFLA